MSKHYIVFERPMGTTCIWRIPLRIAACKPIYYDNRVLADTAAESIHGGAYKKDGPRMEAHVAEVELPE